MWKPKDSGVEHLKMSDIVFIESRLYGDCMKGRYDPGDGERVEVFLDLNRTFKDDLKILKGVRENRTRSMTVYYVTGKLADYAAPGVGKLFLKSGSYPVMGVR